MRMLQVRQTPLTPEEAAASNEYHCALVAYPTELYVTFWLGSATHGFQVRWTIAAWRLPIRCSTHKTAQT